MKSKLQVLMPMGGLGSRFADAGYDTPKPLITVDEVPMFMRALQSFNPVESVQYIFVIRKEHDEKYGLKSSILDLIPSAKIHILDHDTRGAAETCLIAESSIDESSPITIADCDIYFESPEYFDKMLGQELDAMLLTFQSKDPRYSYVELDGDGNAIKTAEKVVISNNAILGGYFFSSGALFKSLAHRFVDAELPEGLKEYYLSHLFNLLITDGGRVAIANVSKYHIFGTPEELNLYLASK